MGPLRVVPAPYDGPLVAPLLAALDADLAERYPGEGIAPPVLTAREFTPPAGTLLVALLDDEPVGCGAVRPAPFPATGEVKRMYVAPQARGRRVAERLLRDLEGAAAGLGYRRLILETGQRQPEALRLYARCGYLPVEAYGHYRDSPLSVCLGRDL
ncbi:MAG: hypothetical protein JWN57_2220 [Frankiales bacterium]|jgi:GNAT superfamily N-acetyltransferase|nr:hypothetical protein [Frankiales bacterium]